MTWKNDKESLKALDEFSKDLRKAFGEIVGEVQQIANDYGADIAENIGDPLREEIRKRITREDGTLHPFAQKVVDHPRYAGTVSIGGKGFILGSAAGPIGAVKGFLVGATIGFFAGPDIKNWVLADKPAPSNDDTGPPVSEAVENPVATAPPEPPAPENPGRKPQAFRPDQ